jgi:hypothetical protein
MAQSRRSRARLPGRIAALVRLAAAPARARRLPSSDHTTPAAGGIQFFRLCQLMRVATAAVPSVLACPLSGRAAMRQSDARRLS